MASRRAAIRGRCAASQARLASARAACRRADRSGLPRWMMSPSSAAAGAGGESGVGAVAGAEAEVGLDGAGPCGYTLFTIHAASCGRESRILKRVWAQKIGETYLDGCATSLLII